MFKMFWGAPTHVPHQMLHGFTSGYMSWWGLPVLHSSSPFCWWVDNIYICIVIDWWLSLCRLFFEAKSLIVITTTATMTTWHCICCPVCFVAFLWVICPGLGLSSSWNLHPPPRSPPLMLVAHHGHHCKVAGTGIGTWCMLGGDVAGCWGALPNDGNAPESFRCILLVLMVEYFFGLLECAAYNTHMHLLHTRINCLVEHFVKANTQKHTSIRTPLGNQG